MTEQIKIDLQDTSKNKWWQFWKAKQGVRTDRTLGAFIWEHYYAKREIDKLSDYLETKWGGMSCEELDKFLSLKPSQKLKYAMGLRRRPHNPIVWAILEKFFDDWDNNKLKL